MAAQGTEKFTDVRTAVADLIARYAHAVDGGRFDDASACFASDGVLDVGEGARSVGPAAISRRFAEAGWKLAASSNENVAFVRHHVSSLVVEMDTSGTSATARSYFLVLTEIGVDHWGRYLDRVVKGLDGQWQFAERRVAVDGRSGPSRMTY